MRINGSIPINVARAYNVQPARGVQAPSAPPTTAPAANTDAVRSARNADALVAGRVAGTVTFAPGAAPTAGAGAALPLYTRAADRVEAAVGVELGRSIDIRG